MRKKILNDLVAAMKNKDKEKLGVLRMAKGAMQLEEINKKRELNDDEVISVIAKQIKTRKESIVEFEKANRQELITQTQLEIDILNSYMPEQMSEEEINKVIVEVFSKVQPESIKDLGKVMKEITPLVKGKADMSLVNKLIKEKLN